MTAQAIVAELRARGVELVPAGDRIRYRPVAAAPPELIERLRAHKTEVLAILAAPPGQPSPDNPSFPAEVHRRSLIFRHQVEQSADGPLPLLILPGVDAKVGDCLSCGVALAVGRGHRCEVCTTAVYLALGAPEP